MASPQQVNKRSIFFPAYALVLLALVFLGFSRTFYLKAWFPSEPLPSYLIIHGVVLTAWFVFFLVQTLLVRADKLATHRRVGTVGAVIAALVVVVALTTVFSIVDRFRSLGMDVEAGRGQISFIVWGNLGALLAYVTFVIRGILKRKMPDSHKRLMLLASISIMSPALIRISAIPPLDKFGGIVFTLAGLLTLTGALMIYDFINLRKLQLETAWSVPFFLVALLGSAFFIPGTGIDHWLLSKIW
ncbi:hypothetical protein [Solilutibacter tolerans]|uniref:Uncharacterized protein n=1 Tax=Solilutibacter tolerans TaxID=1604334 RepID=A0A1N6YL81_9GAMM|nr:hypothetical protein [Lysobacter tolerans]SIR15378.1 hypothetical protein SAMN05421546_0011 [Lysobacter tolerans]